MLRIVLILAVVVGAAIAANVALLSVAGGSHDPVGQLSPVLASSPSARPAATPAVSPRPDPQSAGPREAPLPARTDEDEDDVDADD